MMKKENQCRNSMIEEYDDLPKPKVLRHDGLPTVDDLKRLLGDKKPEPKGDGKNISINVTINNGISDFISKILSSL